MRLMLPLAALLLTCALAPALAADDAPDPAKMALATDILGLTQASGSLNAEMDEMTPGVVASVKQGRPDLSDAALQTFGDLFKAELASELPDILKLEAEIYSDHFTLAELQGLKDFYGSALGRKMVAEMPRIAGDIAPLSMAWGQHAGQLAMARTVEKMKAQGVDIAGVKK